MQTMESFVLALADRCASTNGLKAVHKAMAARFRDGHGRRIRVKYEHVTAIAPGVRTVCRLVIAFEQDRDPDTVYMRITDALGWHIYPLPGRGTDGTDWIKMQFGEPRLTREVLAVWRHTCGLGAPKEDTELDDWGITRLALPAGFSLPGKTEDAE